MVAHLLWEQRVAGSNPVTPTISGSTVAQNVSRGEAMPSYRQILSSVRLVAEVPRARLAAVVRGRSHYLAP